MSTPTFGVAGARGQAIARRVAEMVEERVAEAIACKVAEEIASAWTPYYVRQVYKYLNAEEKEDE